MTLMRESTGREGEEIAEDRVETPNDRRDRRSEPREAREPRESRPQGGERRERDFKPRPERGDAAEAGMVKLFLSLGKNHRVSPGDIVGMLHNECHLERGTVGRIHLFPNFSLVEVAEGEAAHAIEAASRAQLRGQTFKLDYDRGPKEGGFSGGGGRRDDYRDRSGKPGGGYGGGGYGGGPRRDDRSRDDRPRGGGKPSNRDNYDRGRRDR